MAGVFKISNGNSFRWFEVNPSRDSRYNSVPFDDLLDTNNPAGAYAAPWQTDEKAYVQLLSDFVPTLKFYECETDLFYLDVEIPEVPTQIEGETFKCYQAEVDFSLFDPEIYYALLTFNDGVSDRVFKTSSLDIAEKHEGTLLFEGKNSVNVKDIIFDTGIVMPFRFYGVIWADLHEADNELYTDQKHNVTQESSTAFIKFTLTLGGNPIPRGVPPWVIRKMNILFSLDQKKIDGTFYEKAEAGINFEPTRTENSRNPDAFWSIAIVPNENFDIDSYKTGEQPLDTDLIVIAESEGFLDVAADIAIAGLFKTNSTLVGFQITNKTNTPCIIKVGTTVGGGEIATLKLDEDLVSYHLINKGFNGVQTVYLSGISAQGGLDLNIWVRYDQLDKKPTVPSGGAGIGFPKGYFGMYREVEDGDFETHWDIGTGLGKIGTAYYGCAIFGSNGVGDDAEKNIIPAIWDYTIPADRDAESGAVNNLITLTRPQIPALNIKFGTDKKGGNQGVPVLSSDFNGLNPPGSKTPDINMGGEGAAVNITPRILKTLYFVKLTD